MAPCEKDRFFLGSRNGHYFIFCGFHSDCQRQVPIHFSTKIGRKMNEIDIELEIGVSYQSQIHCVVWAERSGWIVCR
jgi:hypothetical protein